MSSPVSCSLFLAAEDETLHLGARMAGCLLPGPPFVVYLQGDLGAGKTTLARGILRALGETGVVRSPTYGLVAEYETPRGRVVHLDLYRLRSPEELVALGLADYLAGSLMWLIEWPEQCRGAQLPQADARVSIEVEGAGRRVEVEQGSDAGQRWLACLSPDSV
jgi:tRNA threonylcarbamoyladenosine biosynthesis protein TsaE